MFQKMKNWWTKRKNKRHYDEYRPYFEYAEADEWVEFQPIRITKGTYAGVVYHYTKVAIKNNLVNFDVNILYAPAEVQKPEMVAPFLELAKNVLLCIGHEMNQGENVKFGLKAGEESEYRNDYPEEPFTERTVRKKDSSVSEE